MHHDEVFSKGIAGNQAQTKESALMSLLREYVSVKEHFDVCCHDLNRARENKSSAEKNLLELSAKVEQAVQDGRYDPTEPRVEQTQYNPTFANKLR